MGSSLAKPINTPMKPITEDMLKTAIPAHLRKTVTSQMVASMNKVMGNPHTWELYRENVLGYGQVLKQGIFSVTQYLNAIRFVTFRLLGYKQVEAYKAAFPDKYADMVAKGVSAKDIASYASAYNRGKLVNLLIEQSLVPSCVLNAPMFQEALNVQAELMLSARSEKVRSDAANSILTHLKRPVTQKIELDIGITQNKTIDALRETTMKLVEAQKNMITNKGNSAKQIAEAPIIMIESESGTKVDN